VSYGCKKDLNGLKDDVDENVSLRQYTSPTEHNIKTMASKPQPIGDSPLLQEIDEARAYLKDTENELTNSYD
jgi:hypothetical protein